MFDQAAKRAGLLADPCRLQVLSLLCRRDHDVGDLARQAGVSIAAMSHHLAKLRLAGMVIVQRRGRHHLYTVTDPQVGVVIDLLVQQVEGF